MKNIVVIATLLSLLTLGSCSSANSLKSSDNDANAEVVSLMLQKKLYKLDFDRAYPLAGPSFYLSYPYFVSVIGDRVESFLPYFGRVFSVPFDGGEGLRFAAPISDYKAETNKKGNTKISFDARSDEDNYNFRIEIFPSGEAYLSVSSSHKQSISFSGRMDLDPDFELIRIE